MMPSIKTLLFFPLVAVISVSALPTSGNNETLALEARANTCVKQLSVDPKVYSALDHYAYKFDFCKNYFGRDQFTEYLQTRTEYTNEGVRVTLSQGPCAGYTTKTLGTWTAFEYQHMPPTTTTVKAPAAIATKCPGVALTQKFPQYLNNMIRELDVPGACSCQNFDTVTQPATTVTVNKAIVSYTYVTFPVCTVSTYAKTLTKTIHFEVTKTKAPKTVTYTSCPKPTPT